MSSKTCGECKWFVLDGSGFCRSNDGTECRGNDACSVFEPKNLTLFNHIIASEETLAEKLVYEQSLIKPDGTYVCRYFSTIVEGGCWLNEDEAFAATVARLKETSDV